MRARIIIEESSINGAKDATRCEIATSSCVSQAAGKEHAKTHTEKVAGKVAAREDE